MDSTSAPASTPRFEAPFHISHFTLKERGGQQKSGSFRSFEAMGETKERRGGVCDWADGGADTQPISLGCRDNVID